VHPRFDDLKAFYTRLEAEVPATRGLPRGAAPASNVCGTCFECCKFNLILTRHEFDCLEDHLIEQEGRSPISWVTCTTPLQDARLSKPVDPDAHCPLYVPGKGCRAYSVRPLACRTFGPLHPRGTLLPQTCAYTESTPFDSVEDLPLWAEYAEIVRRNRPNPPGYFIARPPDPGSNS